MTNNLEQKAEEVYRLFRCEWLPASSEARAVLLALRQTREEAMKEQLTNLFPVDLDRLRDAYWDKIREEALKEGLPEHEEWRLGFEQGKRTGLEEAAKVAETKISGCADESLACNCGNDIAESIRALASGSEEK